MERHSYRVGGTEVPRKRKTLVFNDADGKLQKLDVDCQMPFEQCGDFIRHQGFAIEEFILVWHNNGGTESRRFRSNGWSEWLES